MEEAKNILKLVFATQINPERYKDVESFEELDQLLAESPEDLETITEEINKYSDEEIMNFVSSIAETEKKEKGGKLEYLSSLKKGKKITKKCACGCNMVTVKEKGGKLVSKCACGCKSKK